MSGVFPAEALLNLDWSDADRLGAETVDRR